MYPGTLKICEKHGTIVPQQLTFPPSWSHVFQFLYFKV